MQRGVHFDPLRLPLLGGCLQRKCVAVAVCWTVQRVVVQRALTSPHARSLARSLTSFDSFVRRRRSGGGGGSTWSCVDGCRADVSSVGSLRCAYSYACIPSRVVCSAWSSLTFLWVCVYIQRCEEVVCGVVCCLSRDKSAGACLFYLLSPGCPCMQATAGRTK